MSVLCLYSKVSTKVNARSHILHLTVFRNQFGYRFKYRPIIRVDVQDLVCKDSAATALYMREKMQFGVGGVVSRDIGLHSVFYRSCRSQSGNDFKTQWLRRRAFATVGVLGDLRDKLS